MQAAEFINYVKHPQQLEADSVVRLQQLSADFPYFQAAGILLSLAARRWDASVYQNVLRKTAIMASNRAHLYDLLHSQPENQTVFAGTSTPETVVPAPGAVLADAGTVQTTEDTRQELDILKAAELSTPAPEAETLEVKPIASSSPEDVEKEMGKQLISAYLEKEVLKTTELHNPVKKEETPVSFKDWLTYLRNKHTDPATVYRPVLSSKSEQKPANAPENEQGSAVDGEPAAPPAPGNDRRQKNRALIDRIIESNPGHIKVREESKFYVPDTKARESLQENEHLVTETLAKIYALQGNINKAVRAYEILSLKFPQKSAYFASLIQKLKNNK